jgi:hypothetical protein
VDGERSPRCSRGLGLGQRAVGAGVLGCGVDEPGDELVALPAEEPVEIFPSGYSDELIGEDADADEREREDDE